MSELRRAELIPLLGDEAGTPDPDRPAVPVQFNPASLRLQLTNHSDGGRSRGRQAEQYLGTGATTLSMDLHFDTADTGENVQRLTKRVEQFVLPVDRGGKQAPPRLRFHWGELVFDGLMSAINEDIDYFSPDGVPLRAKLAVTIKGQDPGFARRETGPGAATGTNALPPGAVAAPPGSAPLPAGRADRTGTALGGESAAGFAARMGLDPAAWRGLSAGLDASLSLSAGLEIDFSTSLTVGTGLGARAGVDTAASASPEVRFGLTGGEGAGFALSAAGGVRAAVEAVAGARAGAAASAARSAFAPSGASAAPPPDVAPQAPAQARPRLAGRALPAPSAAAAAAPSSPALDRRSTSYGLGAPLRPRVAGAVGATGGPPTGRVVVRVRGAVTDSAPMTAPGSVAARAGCDCGCGRGA